MDLCDFKHQLASQLKAAGVLSTVKSQLRSQVLCKLQKQECLLHNTPDSKDPLWLSVINSLIQQHLASCNYHYTLSVFQPEAGLGGQHNFGHKDILQVMQVDPSTSLHSTIARNGMLSVKDGHTFPAGSFVMGLLQAVTQVLGSKAVSETGVQTAEYDGSPLSLALQQLENSYLKQTKEDRERPYRNMEQRLAAYRQECEARLQHELQMQVGQVREVEVRAAKLEGIAEARISVQQERGQLQQDHQARLAQLNSQEQQMSEKLERQQKDFEAAIQCQRQLLQTQEEDFAAWKADAQGQINLQQERLDMRQHRLASREQLLTRQDAEAASQVAEAQAAAAAAYSRARQDLHHEYKSQREALATERQALDADRARVQQLEAEVAKLQSSCKKLQAAEASWADAEARAAAHAGAEQALQYQLAHLQNAVKGTGGLGQSCKEGEQIQAVYPGRGGPLSAMQTMALQMRKLQKKQKSTAKALQAAAAREAFWKDTNQATEQALDEAMERREEAVQEVEEARLALRAAQRDNADLQGRLQQQALPPRPGHSHTRPATARQLWAAPRDRPHASATASPHSKLGDFGSHDARKARQDLSHMKSQLANQRQARAQQLRQLLQASVDTSVSGTTAVSVASSVSGYSTDVEGDAVLAAASPMPFISPAHHAGPHMQPKTHTSPSAASHLLYNTHSYPLRPANDPTSVQAHHVQPHAGSLYSHSLLDRASVSSHASQNQHLQPMPVEPHSQSAAAGIAFLSRPGIHAGLHDPAALRDTGFDGMATASSITERLSAAAPQSIQPSHFSPQHKLPSQAPTALQAQPGFLAPVGLPTPAVLPILQQPALQCSGFDTVPTGSAPSRPHPHPQAMDSLTDLRIKPHLTAPAVLPPLDASAASSNLRSSPDIGFRSSVGLGVRADAGRADLNLDAAEPEIGSHCGAPVSGLLFGPHLQPECASQTKPQANSSSNAMQAGTTAEGRPTAALSTQLPAFSSTNPATSHDVTQQIDRQSEQALGTHHPVMAVAGGASSSIYQPRSLMQAVSLSTGIPQEPSAESLIGTRPVQSETALLKGRAATVSEPQDLHAAHLMHVLEAHTTQLRRTGSGSGSGNQPKPAEAGSLAQNQLSKSDSDPQPTLSNFDMEPEVATSQSAVTAQADHAQLPMFQSLLNSSRDREQRPRQQQHQQDTSMGSDTAQAAAQPILFPVMPVAAAPTSSRTVQPALDSSLQLDVTKPAEGAVAGTGIAHQQPDHVQQARAEPSAAAAAVNANERQPFLTPSLTNFTDLQSRQAADRAAYASAQPHGTHELPVRIRADAASKPSGSLNPPQDSPSQATSISGSEGEGFPGVDYNDVYKMSQAFAHQHDINDELPDAEVASLGSVSVADAELEAAEFEVASEDSVF